MERQAHIEQGHQAAYIAKAEANEPRGPCEHAYQKHPLDTVSGEEPGHEDEENDLCHLTDALLELNVFHSDFIQIQIAELPVEHGRKHDQERTDRKNHEVAVLEQRQCLDA